MTKDIQLRVPPQTAACEEAIRRQAASEAGVDMARARHARVLRRSIDARQRQVAVNLTVRLYIDEEPDEETFQRTEYPYVGGRPEAIVVGEGPCGLFAALRLIELGVRPIVLERGKDVHQRKRDVAMVARRQAVDPESNYCFGEGGAGAYSDGKLYTRSKKRGSTEKILRVFCQHGASPAILVDAHPHIGTDRLPRVIENMRKQIIAAGGEVHFQTRMTRLLIYNNKVEGVEALVQEGDGERGRRQVEFRAAAVILATGHSARDVYRYLAGEGIQIEAKGIAVGVRLEHPAHLIDQIQYHSADGRGAYLPAAEYSFVTQSRGRGVYSFCMCPGGVVIPAATSDRQIVVNGMSPSDRAGRWSNSGMVVELRPEDIEGEGALKVMDYQERLEQACWEQAGRQQTAPAQRMADFVEGRPSRDIPRTSYAPGTVASPLHQWLPKGIGGRLQEGFRFFGKQRRGFLTNEAVMLGVETRTSSPVRITRDPMTLQHAAIAGLFPAGEGAGYAGGIVSAGVDGERAAEMATAYINQQQ